MIKAEKITTSFEDAALLQERYLRQEGWEYRCDYPDSCWRWSKMLNGRVMVMNAGEAFNFQETIDSWEEFDEA